MPWNTEIHTDVYVTTPAESLSFWRKVMTRETAHQYRAKKRRTFCNHYVGDTLYTYLGKEIFDKVFPEGVKAPHIMFLQWKANPHLVRLEPALFPLAEVQALADEGYIILLAYYYTKGPSHLGFIGHSGLQFFTIPPIKKLEGKYLSQLDEGWLPVVVQAGTYAGVTSIAYASNGWFRSDLYAAGTVRLYLIRR